MKLGTYGSICLIITLILTKALISTPALYVQHSLSAGWLEILLSGLFEFLILAVIIRLLKNFPNMDILDISYHSFGNFGKILTGSICLMIVSLSSAGVCRSFCELVRNTIIRGHSYENIIFYILIGSVVAGWLGLKPQVNLNGQILPITIISIFIIFLINLSRYSISNIFPILGTGLENIISNAVFKNSSYFELGIFLLIIPFLGDFKHVKQISFTALSISVFLLTAITLTYQLAVPYESAATFAMPLYQMTRMLKAGSFFQRIEPLNVFLWGGAMFVYTSVGVWLSANIFKKTFNLTDDKPMVFIFVVIIGIISLLPGSETSVERIYDFLMTYSYIAYPLLPVAFLIIASLKLRKT